MAFLDANLERLRIKREQYAYLASRILHLSTQAYLLQLMGIPLNHQRTLFLLVYSHAHRNHFFRFNSTMPPFFGAGWLKK